MKQTPVRLFLLFPLLMSLGLAGCAGYRSINAASVQEGAANRIHIKTVEMARVQKKVGQRRVAQNLYQELSRRYEGGVNAPLHVNVVLSERKQSLSSRRDATVSRWMYFLSGTAYIYDAEKEVAVIKSTADAPYAVVDTPIATEANYRQAQDAAMSVLLRDLQRQLSIYWSQEGANSK